MVKPVGDFELQFERLDALETQTASRKPFPEDFSFDKDGSLRDCKTKENAEPETVAIAEPKPEEPIETSIPVTAFEEDIDFEETEIPVVEEINEAEVAEEITPDTMPKEFETEPEPKEESVFVDVPETEETASEEDDEDVDFEDVFGDMEFEETEIPVVQEPDEAKAVEAVEEEDNVLAEETEEPELEFDPEPESESEPDPEEAPIFVIAPESEETEFEEDDEDVDFEDVFGDMEFEETEIPVVQEPDEAKTVEAVEEEDNVLAEETEEPELETEPESEPAPEETPVFVIAPESEETEFEEDDENVDFEDVFGDMEFEETEIPVVQEPDEAKTVEAVEIEDTVLVAEPEETALELEPELELESEPDPEETECEDEDADFGDVFGDMEFEETEIPVAEEITPTVELDETETVSNVPEEMPSPAKPSVTVTKWERVRQRASVPETQPTFETEHFFAVEGSYIDSVKKETAASTPSPARTPLSQITEIRPEDEEEITPIWHVDEPEESDDDTEELSDEDLDYDDVFNDDVAKYRKKKRAKNILKKIFKEFMLFFVIVVSAVFLVANFTIFASRQNTVVGESMEPTLHGGDRVSTTLFPYIFGEPEIGDIIVFDRSMHGKDMGYFHMLGEVLRNNRIAQWICGEENVSADTYWIKRVVAVPGDVVSFDQGKFYRNGKIVEEDYILEQTVTKYVNGESVTVPEGHVFVMGDNRNNSEDSRAIGCISTDIIIGKMWKKS